MLAIIEISREDVLHIAFLRAVDDHDQPVRRLKRVPKNTYQTAFESRRSTVDRNHYVNAVSSIRVRDVQSHRLGG